LKYVFIIFWYKQTHFIFYKILHITSMKSKWNIMFILIDSPIFSCVSVFVDVLCFHHIQSCLVNSTYDIVTSPEVFYFYFGSVITFVNSNHMVETLHQYWRWRTPIKVPFLCFYFLNFRNIDHDGQDIARLRTKGDK
jgi:hypothetical protein